MKKVIRNKFKFQTPYGKYDIKYSIHNRKVVICNIKEFLPDSFGGFIFSEIKTFTGTSKCNFDEGDKFDIVHGKRIALEKALNKRVKYITNIALEYTDKLLKQEKSAREILDKRLDKEEIILDMY